MSGRQNNPATLHLMCGKMAAGKTTLARQLAHTHQAVLICEDLWLQRLYPVEIHDFASYRLYSERLHTVVAPHVQALLRQGVSVVLDFPANVPTVRAGFKTLAQQVEAQHCLHFVNSSDARCKRQLAQRNRERPEGSMVMTEQQFEAISALFQAPTADEGCNLKIYCFDDEN